METRRNFELIDFIRSAATWSFKKFLLWSLVLAVVVWLSIGGLVEQLYLYTAPNTTILEVKVVSRWFKWIVSLVVFVCAWFMRWNEIRLFSK